MSKKPSKNNVRMREELPGARVDKHGYELMCPFCKPAHPLFPGTPAPCGTQLKITAVQPVLGAYVTKERKISCVKCGQTGGEMVPYQKGYVHLVDCDPSTHLLAMPPEFSFWAKIVHGLPAGLQKQIEKRAGAVQQVKEIDPAGRETGKTLGYFFLPKGKPDGKRIQNDPARAVSS